MRNAFNEHQKRLLVAVVAKVFVVDALTCGDPKSLLRWTGKSLRNLAGEFMVSHVAVRIRH